MLKTLTWVVVAGALTAGAALASVAQKAPSTAAHDKQVYGYWCATCHAGGVHDGRLLPGTFSLEMKYGDAKPAVLDERRDLDPNFVKYVIRHGQNGMPFFRKTEISDADERAIVAYLTAGNAVGKVAAGQRESAASASKVAASAAQASPKSKSVDAASTGRSAEQIIDATCSVCHGPQLQGGFGPSLTDATWLHGSAESDIAKSISGGYPDKGMPSFADQLSPAEIHKLVDYIESHMAK